MRRRKLAKRKKIITITSICLLLCLSVGYAAFQTNLSITAKGHIKNKQYTVEDLKELAVTAGDGLYKDAYEEGRFVYKGANPNNYIIFNNETWRIISVENDGSIKILRNEVYGVRAFDSEILRDGSSNGAGGTYCANGAYGCNAWAVNDNFVNGSYSGTVLKDAELNTYLNGEYYNGINSDKDKIVNHNFSVGAVTEDNNDLAAQITNENSYKWNGKIGLITVSEYIRANNNQGTCGTLSLISSNYNICKSTEWMHYGDTWWTLSPSASDSEYVYRANNLSGISRSLASNNSFGNIRPALYLTPNITLNGMGTETNPYIIVEP